MKHITFYLDVISPYAYLAFERLPEALKGLSYSVSYKPVLFAALLKQHGQLGPAEIAPKRDWTYRHVLWLAHHHGIPMTMPASHPFNPLPLLRLAAGYGTDAEPGAPNRFVCETIFRHVWQRGGEASDVPGLDALKAQLATQSLASADDAKAHLKANTDEAIAQNVFGVPAMVVDGRVFWGLDALPMLRDYLSGGAWFSTPEWDAVQQVAVGVRRQG